jgi:hypothetical protein
MLVTAFTSRPPHPANGTNPDLPAKIICTMCLSPQTGFHARCKGLRGHVERYAFLLHAADSLPGGIGDVEVEEVLVGGQRREGTPGRD